MRMRSESTFTLFLLAFATYFLRTLSKTQPPVTKTRIMYIGGDYEDSDLTTPPSQDSGLLPGVTTPASPPHECPYDPCVVPEVPCSVISARTKCYCPGLTGYNELPNPPQVHQLKRGALGEPEIHWCAPFSTVKHYKVVADGASSLEQEYGESSRKATLPGLTVGSKVCVVAVNDAGFSVETESSCARYEVEESDPVALKTGVIAGSVGFLLLLSLAVLIVLWRRRSCKKRGTVVEEGLRNPSYSTNEAL